MRRSLFRAFLIVVVLVFTLVTPSLATSPKQVTSGFYAGKEPSEVSAIGIVSASHTPHGPISIYSNSDFQSQGWPGAGTLNNPYRIEGLEIVSDYDCIHIYGTSAYFVIKNCVARSEELTTHRYGIYLSHVSHGAVVNCTVVNKGYGISVISSCSDVSIANSTISFCDRGIWLSTSSSCIVSGNTIRNTYNRGMDVNSMSSSFVRLNTITNCSSDGVHVLSSGSCVLANNTIRLCSGDGVYFESSDVITIANNSITSNGESGLDNYDSDSCVITDNLITDNHDHGFMNNRGDGCLLQRNSISRNGAYGVWLYYARGCTLQNNVFQNDGLMVSGAELADWMHSVSGNMVNGKSLGYVINASNTIVDGSPYGQFILVNCSGIDIENASLVEADASIALYFSEGCIVNRSSISDSSFGVYLYSSDDCSVTYSDFNSCGVVVTGSSPSNWAHSFTGTIVNGLPIGYFYMGSGLMIDGRAFGQVIMVNCSDSTVRDGDFQNSSQAIGVAFCHRCSIINNTIGGNQYGVQVRSSIECEIENNTVVDTASTGIAMYSSEDSSFAHNTITGGDYGVYLSSCANCSLYETTIEHSYIALFPRNSTLLNISSSLLQFNEYGLYSYWLNDSTIQNCESTNNTLDGAHLRWFKNLNISDCLFEFNGDYGLFSYYSHVGRIERSAFSNNGADGLCLWGTDRCVILDNDVFRNGGYGIDLMPYSEYNVIYGNMIGWNVGGNGVAYLAQNTWDDGISTGNWWADYDGASTYSIDGPGSNVDRYPSGPTNVVNHGNISSQVGTAGVFITWTAYSMYPDFYIVFVNGSVSNSSKWAGHSITVPVPTTTIGIYNYTLFVNDTLGVWAADTVIVTVYDNPPTIDHPYDRECNFDTYEPPIVWHPSDQNPNSFVVYRNSVPVDSGAWNGGSISVEIAGLPVGDYNFTLYVNDTSGNYATDRVMVGVRDSAPWVDSPPDVVYEVGTTGHFIDWNATDINPHSYCIYRNGAIYDSGPWIEGGVHVSIDGLLIGAYNFTAVFTDTGGNNASDTVIVEVIVPGLTTTTSTTSPEIPYGLVAVVAGSGVVIVLVAALIVYRGRSSATS